MRSRLRSFFARQLHGADAAIANLETRSLGRSRQNWSFDLRVGDDEPVEPLILRRDPTGGLVETDRQVEFQVLKALEGTAVPSPVARWLDADGQWFDRPSLIMRREPGTCDYYVLSGERPLEERLRLAREFCDLLAEVHLVDWQATPLTEVLADPGPLAASAAVDQWEAVLRRDQTEPYPEIELVLRWLRARAPRSTRTVLVHGDFKPGNILLDGARVVALLDWELAHLGDPVEDLGWVTQPLRRREHVIPGVWEVEQILERYRARTGMEVDGAALRWWNTFATFRTAVMQVSGLRSFLEERSDEPYRLTAPVLRALLDDLDA